MNSSVGIRRKEIVSSYVSQILQYGSSLIMLPIILSKVPAEELAIWYVFLTISLFVNLLDFGFLPTVIRYASYVFGGAQDIVVEGVGDCAGIKINYQLLKTLIVVVKFFYALLAVGVFAVLLIWGFFYVYPMVLGLDNVNNALFAWLLYVISSCISIYYCYFSAFIIGRGLVYKYQMIVITNKIIYVFISVAGVYYNYGILAISIANMVSVIVARMLEHFVLYDNVLKNNLKKVTINRNCLKKYFTIICKSSYKLGLVSLGAFFILRSNMLLSAKFLDLQQVAQYGLSLQVVQMIVAMSSVLYNSQVPRFHHLRVDKNSEELLRCFSSSIIVAWMIYILGAIAVLFCGNSLLHVMKSNVFLLSSQNLFVLLLVSLLELNHSIFANFITTKNIVPFVWPSLISGLVIFLSSYFILAFSDFGVMGFLIVQFLVQLVYNNWRWPVIVLNDFSVSIAAFVRIGFSDLLQITSSKSK
jgi:O-antigen/teichoic acid export membrane protein